MKISLMFCLLAAGTTIYAEECSQLDILKAQRNGASFDVTLRVVDDMGVPVEGARCEGWMWIDAHKDNGSSYETVTDSNGLARVTGKCGKWVSVAVSKEGYYSSQDEIRFSGLKKNGMLGSYEWQPYGEKRALILKKIRNPVSMVSQNGLKSFPIPRFDSWIGFDLDQYDFTNPYGKGNVADFLLRFSRASDQPGKYEMTMEVSFTNAPYAGGYVVKADIMSEMKSEYAANTNLIYQKEIKYKYCRQVGVGDTSHLLGENDCLVFRTRVVLDEDGEIKSARYGKIYGPWGFVGPRGMYMEHVYFNPTPNDTNLEDLETAERSRRDYLQQQEMRKNRK